MAYKKARFRVLSYELYFLLSRFRSSQRNMAYKKARFRVLSYKPYFLLKRSTRPSACVNLALPV